MSKIALVVLLPLLAVGALVLAVLSFWSIERAPEAVQSGEQKAARSQGPWRLTALPTLARAA